METFTIREAAERCGVSYQAIRKRVDRGSIEVVRKDGVRLIPRAALERAGLWPGERSDAAPELARLQAENERLRLELRELRQLPQQVDGEREARERVELSLHRERAERTALEQRLRQAEQARAEAAGRLERLTGVGFVARQRLLHDLRAARAGGGPAPLARRLRIPATLLDADRRRELGVRLADAARQGADRVRARRADGR